MSKYFDNKELFLEPTVKQYGSHMVMTNVTKSTKTKYVNIDTKFRDEYNYNRNANYNITIPERINDVKNISVTNIEIPLTYYNISSNIGNNTFTITYSGTTVVVTVTDGQYTSSSLVTEIDNKINAIGENFSQITFSVSNNFSVISPGNKAYTINFCVDASGNFDKNNVKSRLGWLLGFRAPTYTTVVNTNLTSESILYLNGPKYLYLVVDEFNKGVQNSFISPLPSSLLNKNILSRISINSANYSFGQLFPANRYNGYLISDNRSYTGKVDLQKLNVQLVDENGTPVNLNGADFSFCLEIEHE